MKTGFRGESTKRAAKAGECSIQIGTEVYIRVRWPNRLLKLVPPHDFSADAPLRATEPEAVFR